MACRIASQDLNFISKMDLEMEMTAQTTGFQEVHSANIEHLLHARLCLPDVVRQEGDDVPLVEHQSGVRGASGASVWGWVWAVPCCSSVCVRAGINPLPLRPHPCWL